MATINSKLYDKQDAPGAANLHDSKEFFGRVRHAYISLNTTDQPVGAGDVIRLCKLPQNARVLGVTVFHGAMGAGRTIIIGDAGDTDRYLESTSVASAGNTTAIASTGFGYQVEDPVVICTTAGGAFATGQTLRVLITFVLD